MKWVMCNSGHGGAQRPKVYFGYNLSLEVWGSKGEWRFGLFSHRVWSKFCLHGDGYFDTQSEAKKAAERWFSEWVIEQFRSKGVQVE